MGGRGSSSGAKGGGGGGAKAATNAEEEFVNEMVAALNVNDPDEIPMSNSDVQAAVEAFAMTHPNVDENALLDEINRKATNTTATPNEVRRANAFNDGAEQVAAAEGLYSIERTTAFPSNDTIVNHVPSLKNMKQQMTDAPIGTTVAARFGNDGNIRVMEKTGTRQWTMTDMRPASDGGYRQVGGSGKYQGLKAMQMMSTVLNEGGSLTNALPQSVSTAYKNIKR